MPRRKNYALNSEPSDSGQRTRTVNQAQIRTGVLRFADELGEDGRFVGGRSVDLTDWLNIGIDDWVYSCITAMRQVLRARLVETATLVTRRSGLRTFFEFLVSTRHEDLVKSPQELTVHHVRSYCHWLKDRCKRKEISWNSARGYYFSLKSMVGDLYDYGHIPFDPADLFRDNPFRQGATNKPEATPALSASEQAALAQALKRDLVDSRKGRISLRPSESAASRFLITAFRTGESLVPLLELSRVPPAEGIFPGTLVLDTVRRRGRKVVRRGLRKPEDAQGGGTASGQSPQVISTDAAAILRLMIEETAELVPHAPAMYKDRIWLYRKTRGAGSGDVTALTQAAVHKATKAIVTRHQLKGDDGKPLRVGVRRLRTSFGLRAYDVSGGSLELTADLLGNTTQVAGSNYLPITEVVKTEAAAFMAGLPSRLTGRLKERITPSQPAGDEMHTITPVANCRDAKGGEFAPKDSHNFCDAFVMCLFCKDCAITGDDDGLWRLFSFRDFAERELERLVQRYGTERTGDERSDLLKELYRLAIPFIGEFARSHFNHRVVYRAEKRAKETPSPFWVYQDELAALRR